MSYWENLYIFNHNILATAMASDSEAHHSVWWEPSKFHWNDLIGAGRNWTHNHKDCGIVNEAPALPQSHPAQTYVLHNLVWARHLPVSKNLWNSYRLKWTSSGKSLRWGEQRFQWCHRHQWLGRCHRCQGSWWRQGNGCHPSTWKIIRFNITVGARKTKRVWYLDGKMCSVYGLDHSKT